MHVTSNPICSRANPTLWNSESRWELLHYCKSGRCFQTVSAPALSWNLTVLKERQWARWMVSFTSQCRGELQVLQEERISRLHLSWFWWNRRWVAYMSQTHLPGWQLSFRIIFLGLKMQNIPAPVTNKLPLGKAALLAHFVSTVKHCAAIKKRSWRKNDDYIQEVQ